MSSTAERSVPRGAVREESADGDGQDLPSRLNEGVGRLAPSEPANAMVQFRGHPSCDSQPSDEALLSLTREGDGEALSFLFRRYAGLVRGVAYKVLRNPAEADDLLQDVFLLVHRLCRTFDSSKGSARFWILQMTYRRAISRRRYLTSPLLHSH
jgi:hypothetical protein